MPSRDTMCIELHLLTMNKKWLAVEYKTITLEYTQCEIKNYKSRETGNIGYTKHKTKTNKTKTQKTTQYVQDTTIRNQTQIT